MKLARVLIAVLIALGVAVTMAVTASASGTQSASRPRGSLYFVSGGFISRVPAGGGPVTRLVRVGGLSVTGMTIAGGRLYYLTQDNGRLSYVWPRGGAAHTLVSGLDVPVGLVSAGGWLFWAGQHAIGRVRPDGSGLTRRFVTPRQEAGGGVADGLATDGRHLFFSRCQDSTIGAVAISGRGLTTRFVTLPVRSCPQALAVGGGHLYWTEIGGHIGRATLAGRDASAAWLSVRTSQGPFNVAAGDADVYWDWGGAAGSPEHVGTATTAGTGLRTSFLTGQGAFFLTSRGANT